MKFNSEKDKLFFTADQHFNHDNIIKFCNRPFLNVKEMNEAIIERWNQVVPIDGITFLIGDVGFGNAEILRGLIDRLNGKIYFISGNHDSPALHRKCCGRFEIFNSKTKERHQKDWALSIEDKDAPSGIQKIHLYHYAVVDWEGRFHGSWHLHGHSHQTIIPTEIGKLLYKMKIIDVGVDGHNFTPLSYQEVKQIMSTRNIS